MNSSTTLLYSKSTELNAKQEPKTQITELKLKLHKKVTWSEDTIDNENLNKKKSKICCIFKKPILNPDDPSSSSCSSCDEKGKNAYERPNHYDRQEKKHHHNKFQKEK